MAGLCVWAAHCSITFDPPEVPVPVRVQYSPPQWTLCLSCHSQKDRQPLSTLPLPFPTVFRLLWESSASSAPPWWSPLWFLVPFTLPRLLAPSCSPALSALPWPSALSVLYLPHVLLLLHGPSPLPFHASAPQSIITLGQSLLCSTVCVCFSSHVCHYSTVWYCSTVKVHVCFTSQGTTLNTRPTNAVSQT